MTSILPRLQEWYAAQCDGEWEHRWGVKFETLVNPGWLVTIDLIDPSLATREFANVAEGIGTECRPRSFHCTVHDGIRRVRVGGLGSLEHRKRNRQDVLALGGRVI